MVVRTQSDGRVVTGLYVGARNARRQFRKVNAFIELQLDYLNIRCKLAPEFWHGRPEIRDQRLCDWLDLRIFHGRPCRMAFPMLMQPMGGNVYRLVALRVQSPASEFVILPTPAAAPAANPTACEGAVCRVRNFIRCAADTSQSFIFPESPA